MQPQRRRQLVAMLGIATATGIAWLTWQAAIPDRPSVVALHPSRTQLPADSRLTLPTAAHLPAGTAWPAGLPDIVGTAPDLKRVFDTYIGSDDARLHRLAVRAFDACLPAFQPGDGQSASPENLIAGLPPDQRTAREPAYRALFARCHRLLAQSRAMLAGTRQAFDHDALATPPGIRAQERLLAGETENLQQLVAEAVSSGDPQDVADLSGIAGRLTHVGADGAPVAMQEALETDAALLLASCDLGRDCSTQSLWALQLCAADALCDGDVTDRLALRNRESGIDGAAVERRRRQLRDAIRSGTAAQLFPLPAPATR